MFFIIFLSSWSRSSSLTELFVVLLAICIDTFLNSLSVKLEGTETLDDGELP